MINEKIINAHQIYGDAFYILDTIKLKNNFKELKYAFRKMYSNFNIAYSYKTNYIPEVCKIINEMGGYAEVVSEMELMLALKVGVKYKNIIWNGPIKNIKELEKFLLHSGVVNIDSIDELDQIESIAKKYQNEKFRLGIRCNFDISDGVISRFGIDVNSQDFYDAVSFISNNKNIEFNNLHCHFANRELTYWPARVTGIIELIDKIGIYPKRIDLGGGIFGKMPNSLKEQFNSYIPTYDEYARSILLLASKFNGDDKPEIVIEPGTALIGDCMKFVGAVKSIKNIRGKWFATIFASQKNIGMNGLNPPIDIISLSAKANVYNNLDFVGYTCIENDVIFKNFNGKLGLGDLIVINNCGSYSIVMKPPFIMPNFPIVDISGDGIKLIKRAENFKDIFDTYIF